MRAIPNPEILHNNGLTINFYFGVEILLIKHRQQIFFANSIGIFFVVNGFFFQEIKSFLHAKSKRFVDIVMNLLEAVEEDIETRIDIFFCPQNLANDLSSNV